MMPVASILFTCRNEAGLLKANMRLHGIFIFAGEILSRANLLQVMFLYLLGGAVGSAAFLFQEYRQLQGESRAPLVSTLL